MIRVHMAPEPEDFHAKVRQPGLGAIAELVGDRPAHARTGRPRNKVADHPEDIPASKFPDYWTRALEDLLTGYNRVCAWLCLYIPRGTGAPSVDHMVPKSMSWDKVYEWDNYRLACSLLNARRGLICDVLDPFEVEDGWIELDLVEFQVVASPGLQEPVRMRVEKTIRLLKLNASDCCIARRAYATEYEAGHISHDYLRRHAPFVARELERQNGLNPKDVSRSKARSH